MRSFLCLSFFFVLSFSSPKFLQSSNIGFFQKNCAVSVLAPRHHTMDNGTFAKLMPFTKKRKLSDSDKIKNFYFAIENLDCDLVKEMIMNGIDVNVRNDDNKTPLHKILELNNTFNEIEDQIDEESEEESDMGKESKMQIVRYLVENGADIEAEDNWKKRPIHRAVGFHSALKYLVDMGADINVQDELGKTPLHLLSHMAYSAEDISDGFSNDCGSEDEEYYFETEDKDEGDDEIDTSNLESLKYLLQKGANPNIKNHKGETPLYLATFFRCLEAAKALVDAGASINVENNRNEKPLFFAIERGYFKIVTYFFENSKNKNAFYESDKYRKSPFLLAMHAGYKSIISFFMTRKDFIDLDQKDPLGNTALHFATERNNFDLVKELVESGVNVNAINQKKHSPLYNSVNNNNIKITQYLLKNGADIFSATSTQSEMFLSLIEHKQQQLLQDFLEMGFDLKKTDNAGRTPLFYAVLLKNVEMVNFLISLGANVYATDNMGKNIFSYAGFDECSFDKLRKNTEKENIDLLTQKLSKTPHSSYFELKFLRNSIGISS